MRSFHNMFLKQSLFGFQTNASKLMLKGGVYIYIPIPYGVKYKQNPRPDGRQGGGQDRRQAQRGGHSIPVKADTLRKH